MKLIKEISMLAFQTLCFIVQALVTNTEDPCSHWQPGMESKVPSLKQAQPQQKMADL